MTEAIYSARIPLSRAGVADRTGLTKATVSALVSALVSASIVAELPLPPTRGLGRPGVPLGPCPRSLVGLGMEINADYYGALVIDLAGDIVSDRIVTADLRSSNPRLVLRDVAALARELIAAVTEQEMHVVGARLAVPGLVRVATGRLEVAPNLGWRAVDMLPLLDLEGLDVAVWNEAKLAGLAQTMGPAVGFDGTPTSLNTFVYVSGGVGIGSAIVLDGALYQGLHGWNGEIGHVTIHPRGPSCRCGNRGCLEQYAGEEAILVAAGLPLRSPMSAVAVAARKGNRAARAAVDRAGDALGRALSDYLNLVDIDTVVLGGIYAELFDLIEHLVGAHVSEGVLSAQLAPISLLAAPQRQYPAMTGGARAVLKAVLADPAGSMPGQRHT
ncbi:MAG: ROK family protein [Nakamurella sp.]